MVVSLLALAAAAQADAGAGGYRVWSARPEPVVGLRALAAPGPVSVFQQVPRARYGRDRVSGDVEVVLGQATDGLGWDEVGLGRLTAGLRVHVGEARAGARRGGGGAARAPPRAPAPAPRGGAGPPPPKDGRSFGEQSNSPYFYKLELTCIIDHILILLYLVK